MSDLMDNARDVTRITCMVHQQLDESVVEKLRGLGTHTVLLENARCVRQHVRSRLWGLPGFKVDLMDAPMEIFRTTVPRESALRVMRELAEAVDLQTPGRGSVYAQDIREISRSVPPEIEPAPGDLGGILRDLTLITVILSRSGSGEALARIALKLGAGVPVVSLGTGTGLRDRLGLLRITIPPEKELIHLMVPTHDAAGVQRLLVEEGRINRPGGGFLYQTRIRAGIVDPLVRIGRQEHAASIEQIIAAMDELQRGTSWRKRFAEADFANREVGRPPSRHREIVFVCPEGRSRDYARTAIRVGAPGATVARVRCLSFSDVEGGVAARERGILCVPALQEEAVLNALCEEAASGDDNLCRLQSLEVPGVFFHNPR